MEAFVRFFVRRPVLSTMLFTAMATLGITSAMRMKIDLLPPSNRPGITILTRYSGMTPYDIQKIITVPMERILSGISSIESIISESTDNESRVHVLFNRDADMRSRIMDVSENLQLIKDNFPREVEKPVILQYDPNKKPVYILTAASTSLDTTRVRGIVENSIKPKFERIDGVSEIQVYGGRQREIQVLVPVERILLSGSTLDVISGAIDSYNNSVTVGKTYGANSQLIRVDNKFRNPSDIESLFSMTEKGGLFRLSDMVSIEDHYRPPESLSRMNGEERVSLYVDKAGTANSLSISEACSSIFDEIKKSYPDISFSLVYDQGKYIRSSIDRLSGELISGSILAALIVFLFTRNFSLTSIVALTIPFCVATTLFILFFMGFDLNVMTMSGLAMSSGMVIDNSIIVTASLERILKRKLNVKETADLIIQSTSSLGNELFSGTLSTVIVFFPLLFVSREIRDLFSALSVSVTAALLISIFFSLAMLPAFVQHLNSSRIFESVDNGFFKKRINDPRIKKWIAYVETNGARAGSALESFLKSVIRWMMQHTYLSISIAMIVTATGVVAISFMDIELSNPLQTPEVSASVDLQTGTHLEETNVVISRIEKALASHPAVERITTTVEKWHGTLNIKIKSKALRYNDLDDVIDELEEIGQGVDRDAFVYFDRATGDHAMKSIQVDFFSDNVDLLRQTATRSSTLLKSRIDNVDRVILHFREKKEDLQIAPQRNALARTGMNVSQLAQQLRYQVFGAVISKLYIPEQKQEIDIRLMGEKNENLKLNEIERLTVSNGKSPIPLSGITDISRTQSETSLRRKNKVPTLSISVEFSRGSVGSMVNHISSELSANLPDGVVFAFGDEIEKADTMRNQMIFAIALSIVVIYLLLGFLFESFIHPLIILTVIPVSLGLTSIFLFLFVGTLNLSIFIGLLLLGGNTVNNSILIASEIIANARNGANPYGMDALIHASILRLKAALMTTLTTVIGMSPLIFDYSDTAGLWRPLALTVVFGITAGLFVSLIAVPLLYYLIYGDKRNETVTT